MKDTDNRYIDNTEEIVQLDIEDLKAIIDETDDVDEEIIREAVPEPEALYRQGEEEPFAASDADFGYLEDESLYSIEDPAENEPKIMRLLLEPGDGLMSDPLDGDLYEAEEGLLQASNRSELLEKLVFYVKKSLGCRTGELFMKSEGFRWLPVHGKRTAVTEAFLYSDRGLVPLLTKKRRPLDTENYKNVGKYAEDCALLDSFGYRLIVPVSFKEELLAFIAAGAYDRKPEAVQIATALNICNAAGVLLHSFLEREKLENEVLLLKGSISGIAEGDRFLSALIGQTDLKEISKLLRKKFAKHAIESCSLFIKNLSDNRFFPVISEEKDYIGLKESPVAIDEISLFMNVLYTSDTVVDVADFWKAPAVKAVFSADRIKRMNLFRLYPFLSGGHPAGFIALFRIRPNADINEIDEFLQKISGYIFPTLYMLQMRGDPDKYGDGANALYQRINLLFKKADMENCPVSLLMLSVKNFRRFDRDKILHISAELEKGIGEHLSDDDFASPYGRNGFMVVLPNRNRNYALRLGAAVRNYVVDRAGDILLSFLSVQYPDDGRDLFGLLDILD